jgi:hypothetical protein
MNAADVAAAIVDAYNRHDLIAYTALHAATARVRFANAPGELDISGWTQQLARFFTAVPDLAVTPLTVCHSARSIMLELRQTGTNTGALVLDDGARAVLGRDLDHIPATGRRIDATGVVVLDVVAGTVVTERHHWPPAWLYQQLGLATVMVRPTTSPAHQPQHRPEPPLRSRGG